MNHMVDLPNQEGFRFTGIFSESQGENRKIPCIVVRDPVKRTHYVVTDDADRRRVYSDLIGWEHIQSEKEVKQ